VGSPGDGGLCERVVLLERGVNDEGRSLGNEGSLEKGDNQKREATWK